MFDLRLLILLWRTVLLGMLCCANPKIFAQTRDISEAVKVETIIDDIQVLYDQYHKTEKPQIYDHDQKKRVPAARLTVTPGLLTDYFEIIDFIKSRHRFAFNQRTQENPLPVSGLYPLHNKISPITIFTKAHTAFVDKNGNETFPVFDHKEIRATDRCIGECAKLLFEGYTDEIVYVSVDPETREVVPNGVFSFTRADSCEIKPGDKPSYVPATHELPALGLCFKREAAEVPKKGFRVYYNIASPLWPSEFETDIIRISPQSFRFPKAFERFQHIDASVSDVEHRAYEINLYAVKASRKTDYERACLIIKPTLPKAAIQRLVDARTDKQYRVNAHLKISDGGICYGRKQEDYGHFFRRWDIANGKMDFPKIITPAEIENELVKTMNRAKSLGVDGVSHWAAIAEAIDYLQQHHPGFDNDIIDRVAPILIEAAKFDHEIAFSAPVKVLRKVPHKSMAPYLDDLIGITKTVMTEAGCIDLACDIEGDYVARSRAINARTNITRILNGVGPEAEPFLEELFKAGHKGAAGIASCAGALGPETRAYIRSKLPAGTDSRSSSSRGYRTVNVGFAQMLRTEPEASEANMSLEKQLESYYEILATERLDPKWATTHNLYNAMQTVTKALATWDTQTQYCPDRVRLPTP